MPAAPSIRGFQLDSTSVGDVRSNVNLFRGDVNLSQTLFTMPGRSSDQALDVSVTLLYQSNVTLNAWSWNQAHPTGTIGLGWSLPLERIELQSGVTPEARSYQLVSSGSGATLIPEPAAPTLFSLPASAASGLVNGAAVPSALVAGFVSMGTSLSTTATATLQADGSWLVADDDAQRLFRVVVGDAAVIQDGGESFQLQSYSFWRILYYARYERWAITDESGLVKSYGGLTGSVGRGGSIAWSVLWSKDGSAPAWKGASNASTGALRSARAWYLESVHDTWGDVVRYAYNEWDPQNGVIPVVEQLVGETGLAYTKAVYLTSITDVFGRVARFTYGDKCWDNDDARAREYADPHKAVPDNTANVWQDCYETRYLADISVQDTDGSELFGVALSYLPSPDSADPAVVNLTQATGRLAGDCAKRLLTGLTIRHADGTTQPATNFSYYTDPTADGYAPGALATLTTPGGAAARYAYNAQDLDVCQRAVVASGPEDAGSVVSDAPRIWYGDDYAVVLWVNGAAPRLSMQVYTWQGRWIAASTAPITLTNSTFVTDSVQVCCTSGFFAVSVQVGTTCPVYLFTRDPAQPWSFAPTNPDGTLAADNAAPTALLTVAVTAASRVFTGSEGFLLVGNQTSGSVASSLTRYTWSFTTRTWSSSPHSGLSSSAFWVTTGASYYFLINNSGANLCWVDAAGTWSQSATLSKPKWWQSNMSLSAAITLSAGGSLVAVGYQTGTSTAPTLGLAIYQWDANHNVTIYADSTTVKGTLPVSGVSPPLGTPMLAEDTVVGMGPWVWRFDGTSWTLNSALYKPQSAGYLRFSHSSTLSLCVSLASSATSAPVVSALVFDGSAWASLKATTPATALPSASSTSASMQNWPNAGSGDWALIGRHLYFRGNAPSWATALAAAPIDLQSLVNGGSGNRYLIDTQTLVNQGPLFLGFNILDTQTSVSSNAWFLGVAPLANGALLGGAPIELSSDRLSDGGAGQSASARAVLCTYPASATDFSHAPSLTLRRYAGDSLTADPSTPTAQLSGNIRHYAVARFTVDDGLSTHSTSIVADPYSAACDSSGTVAKYYDTTVIPGSSDPNRRPYGSVVSTYINGLGGDASGGDVMLDGLAESVTLHDAADIPLSTISLGWTSYRQRAVGPLNPSDPPLHLYGGFVVRSALQRSAAGVTASRVSSYIQDGFSAPWSAQTVRTTTTRIGSTGTVETVQTDTTAAATLSPLYAALNMLSTQAGQRTTWASGQDAAVPTRASASRSIGVSNQRGVTVPAQSGSYAWKGIGDAVFPWEDPSDLSEWITVGTVSKRDAWGMVEQHSDAGGVTGSVRRTTTGSIPIAGCNGAALDAWRATSFEEDDPSEGFTMTGSSWSEDCWMGTRSLCLAPGGTLSVSLSAAAGTMLWSGRVRAADQASLSLSISADGVALPSATITGQGRWAHALIPVKLNTAVTTLTLTLSNPTSASVLVDMVGVCPMSASLLMQTVDRASRQVTAKTSIGGVTSRNYFSAAGLQIGQSGPGDQLISYSVSGASRRASAADTFVPSHPNALWTLQPAGGGRIEALRSGDDWATRWVPASGTTVSRANGALILTGRLDAAVNGGFAVVVEVAQQGSGWIGFRLGSTSIGWNNGWSWPGGPTPVATPTQLGSLWMLMVADGQLVLVVDGLLVYSGDFDATGLAQVSLDTGSTTAQLRNLGLVAAPRLSVSWQDGTAQDRQLHYREGADSRVSAVLRDDLGRTVASTRTAPGSTGSGASLPPLAYRPGFVDEAAFFASLGSTWAMHGDVADFYAETDGAFPYAGTRYEASPRKRKLEQGAPSAALAITNVEEPPSTRATTSWSYATTPVAGGEMAQRTTRDPVGRQCQSTQTGPRGVMASETLSASAAPTGRASRVSRWAEADDGGVCTMLRQTPAGGGTGVPSADDPFVSRSVLDPLQRQLQSVDPDTGTTQFWYTADGKMRFAQPALDAGAVGFIYQRYDARGRLIETGTIDAAVDDATLAAQVDNEAWPDGSVAYTPVRAWAWDGDGSQPFALGTNTEVVTTLPAPDGFTSACVVRESFAHDASGRVIGATLAVDADTSFSATIGYAYNPQGELLALHFPEGSPLSAVFYRYNDQGQVVAIGTTPGGDDIAAYTYTPDGLVETEQRGALTGRFSWDGAGRSLGQQLTVGGATAWALDLLRAADGAISEATETWSDGATHFTATYDGNGRLSRWQPDSGAGDEQVSQYDANGNVLAARLDDATTSVTLSPNSNRLATVTLGSTTSNATTSAAGYVSAYADLSLVMDRTLGLPIRAARGGVTLRLGYGGQGQRALRQVAGGATRFAHYGAGGVPLLWSQDGAISIAVWGPTGLVMVADQDGWCYPACDAQHTVRGLFDATGVRLARWGWSAFGSLITSDGDTSRLFVGYQGQEWDADLQVHAFLSRLYDPSLRRFLAPDPARQYASPYVFVGNNPLQNIDATGQVGAEAVALTATTTAEVGVAAVGAALTVFTLGASDAVAAGIEASLVATESVEVGAAVVAESTELVVEASVEASSMIVEEGAGEVAEVVAEGSTEVIEAGSTGAAEISTGAEVTSATVETTEATSTAAESTGKSVAKRIGKEALKGAARSSVRSAIQYNVQGIRNGDWSVKGLLGAMGKGAAAGAISGALCGAAEIGLERVIPGASKFKTFGKLCIGATASISTGIVCNDMTQMVSNARNGDPLYNQLGRSTVSGAISGAVSFAALETVTRTIGATASYTIAMSATVVTTVAGQIVSTQDATTSLKTGA